MIAKLPKVSGGDGQTYIDPSLVRVLDEAETVAKKAGDSFVPVERLLTALALALLASSNVGFARAESSVGFEGARGCACVCV